jgi:L-lactate dehydrogenase (cytochrome)/(S)-mandelate dehydrogenase
MWWKVKGVVDEPLAGLTPPIRRGTDVVKALCLGARAVCIGRPFLYGLATQGPPGVRAVFRILHDEIERTLTLMGVGSLDELGPDWLAPADQHRYIS